MKDHFDMLKDLPEDQLLNIGRYLLKSGDKPEAYEYYYYAAIKGSFEAQCGLCIEWNKCLIIDDCGNIVLNRITSAANDSNELALLSLAELYYWGNDTVKKDYEKAYSFYCQFFECIEKYSRGNPELKEYFNDEKYFKSEYSNRLYIMQYFGLGCQSDHQKAIEGIGQEELIWLNDGSPIQYRELCLLYADNKYFSSYKSQNCSIWDESFLPLIKLVRNGIKNMSFAVCFEHYKNNDYKLNDPLYPKDFLSLVESYSDDDVKNIFNKAEHGLNLYDAFKKKDVPKFEEFYNNEDRSFLKAAGYFIVIKDVVNSLDGKRNISSVSEKYIENSISLSNVGVTYEQLKYKYSPIVSKLDNSSSSFIKKYWKSYYLKIPIILQNAKSILKDPFLYGGLDIARKVDELLNKPEISGISDFLDKSRNDNPTNATDIKKVFRNQVFEENNHIDLLSIEEAKRLAELLAGKGEYNNDHRKDFLYEEDIDKFVSFFSDGSFKSDGSKQDASKIRWRETWHSLKKLFKILFYIKQKQAEEERKRQAEKKHPKHVKMPTKDYVYAKIVNDFVFGPNEKQITVSSIKYNSEEKGLNDNEIKILENMVEMALGIE